MSQTTSPVPGGSPPAPDPASPDPASSGPSVAVTIMDNHDGSFTVYAGDEPEGDESGDMSGDDAAAMGPSGDMPAPQGEPADSVGAALKIVMGLLQGASSSGSSPDADFAAGFGGGGGAPSSMAQKL